MLFNKAKGVTEPGFTPSKFIKYSSLAKDTLPKHKNFEIFLRFMFVYSSHEIKQNLFFLFFKNKFLLCDPFICPLNLFESSTVKSA